MIQTINTYETKVNQYDEKVLNMDSELNKAIA